MELEGNKTQTYRILGDDTPDHASKIKQEMEKMGVGVTIISRSEDLHEYTNAATMKENNVVIVIDVPINVNTVEMFQRMYQCLQKAS